MVLEWMTAELQARTNFELVQAVLNRVLQTHSDTIVARSAVATKLGELHDAQREAWEGLHGLMQKSLCLVQFFSGLS